MVNIFVLIVDYRPSVQPSQVSEEDVQMSVEVLLSGTAPILPGTSCTASSSSQATSTDHNYAVSSPTKLRRDVNSLTYWLRSKISAIRNVRRRETRLRGKVNDLLHRLKSMQLLTTQAEELLEAYKDIPLALLSGCKDGRYNEDQKQFATTLHFYSPAAYQYARQRFKLLPCPRTIRNWLMAVDGSPGITQNSFDTIAEKSKAGDQAYKLCALHVDEMEIKRHVDLDRNTRRLVGFTDIGTGTDLNWYWLVIKMIFTAHHKFQGEHELWHPTKGCQNIWHILAFKLPYRPIRNDTA